VDSRDLLSVMGATTGTATGASSFGSSGCALEDSPSILCSSFFSSALSFFPRSPPKMEVRLPRDAERDLDLAFLALFSSSEELLDEEPARAGAATIASSVAGASVVVSAGLRVASVLFLGAEVVAAAASAVGLPGGCQSTAKLTERRLCRVRRHATRRWNQDTYRSSPCAPCSPRWPRCPPWPLWPR
jgi:hypothetical protein